MNADGPLRPSPPPGVRDVVEVICRAIMNRIEELVLSNQDENASITERPGRAPDS